MKTSNLFTYEYYVGWNMVAFMGDTVRVSDSAGCLTKVLDLGFRHAGYYIFPEDAVRWDGRNECGEKVASGVYFYVIRAGGYTATRKMLLMK